MAKLKKLSNTVITPMGEDELNSVEFGETQPEDGGKISFHALICQCKTPYLT